MTEDHPILARRWILETQGHQGPWIALFDIDSTLMDTAPRNAAILREAVETLPALEPWRSGIEFDGNAWSVTEPLHRAGIVDAGVRQAVQTFWRDRFFTDEWLALDRPYPGVPEYLWALKDLGFRLAYLTGRHGSGMEKGTRLSFQTHGLPCGPEEEFFFKPSFEMGDRDFKESVCHAVGTLGTLVVSVDNEPANVNLFRRAFPGAMVVWVDTLASPGAEPLDPEIDLTDPRFFLDRPRSRA